MNISEIDKRCTGCAACVDGCSFGALKLKLNKNGFYEPVMDNDKCVDCGKCVKLCPELKNEIPKTDRKFYYGYNNDESVRLVSSSGGVFSVLANQVLDEGGVVFGAAYSDDFKSVKIMSTEDVPLSSFRTSKYVHSNAQGAYNRMSELLKNGKKVLFCAAPCQIAGARSILGTNNNLILVDFLCGGFASAGCFCEYIEYLQKKYKSKVCGVNFRNKEKGWTNATLKIDFENGKTYRSLSETDYYYYYYNTPYIRNSSCNGCKFRESRYADITIADFWGFREMKLAHDNKGLSLIVTYNENGSEFLQTVKDKLTLFEITEEQGSYGFVSNEKTEEQLLKREKFLRSVRKHGFIRAAKRNHFLGGKFGIFIKKAFSKIITILKK